MKLLIIILPLTLLVSNLTFAQKGVGYTKTYAPGTVALCEQEIKGKIGDVSGGTRSTTTLQSCPVHILTINVSKFAGRAKTDVKIFVNGVEHTSYHYPNGPGKPAKKVWKQSGMQGKKIEVKVYNRSVGNYIPLSSGYAWQNKRVGCNSTSERKYYRKHKKDD